jgi:hypothetical protein
MKSNLSACKPWRHTFRNRGSILQDEYMVWNVDWYYVDSSEKRSFTDVALIAGGVDDLIRSPLSIFRYCISLRREPRDDGARACGPVVWRIIQLLCKSTKFASLNSPWPLGRPILIMSTYGSWNFSGTEVILPTSTDADTSSFLLIIDVFSRKK